MTEEIARNEMLVCEMRFDAGYVSSIKSLAISSIACKCSQWRCSRNILAIAATIRVSLAKYTRLLQACCLAQDHKEEITLPIVRRQNAQQQTT